ncbi:MAG: hypothetical protein PHW93_02145 [Candidatus Methanomethylophilaceae archaeon]|nr:hypothetical protein [Candidatus Methanomethylophilaceae archaeon]
MKSPGDFICRHCGHEEDFRLTETPRFEIEAVFQDYDDLLRAVGDKTIARRAHLLWNRRRPHPRLLRHQQCLYHCPRCHRLSRHLFFRLGILDHVYEPDYLCPDCRSLLIPCLPDESPPDEASALKLWRCSLCNNLNDHGKADQPANVLLNNPGARRDGGHDAYS